MYGFIGKEEFYGKKTNHIKGKPFSVSTYDLYRHFQHFRHQNPTLKWFQWPLAIQCNNSFKCLLYSTCCVFCYWRNEILDRNWARLEFTCFFLTDQIFVDKRTRINEMQRPIVLKKLAARPFFKTANSRSTLTEILIEKNQ